MGLLWEMEDRVEIGDKGFSMVRLVIKYGMTLKDMLISEDGCKQLGV